MDMHEWYYTNVVKPKQDWAKVSQQAKIKKVLNKKSKRDIEREDRIEALGGEKIEVTYGYPLEETVRQARKELEWDLKYPQRKEKKAERKPKATKTKGKDRTPEDLLESLVKGAKARAKKSDLPFDLEPADLFLPEVCPVLGVKLAWSDVITNATPSIDRLVPEDGYVKGNCVIISMRANRLKNNSTVAELEAILAYIQQHHR